MADEKMNIGPDEANAAEPEVTERAAGDSPPEAAAPEPEQAETAEPGMDDPSAEELPGVEHEPDAPGDTPPQEADAPDVEQPGVTGAVVEDAPAQESLFVDGAPAADGPAVEPPAAEETEAPAPGNDGEVVVPFEKISELITERNKAARDAVEQETADIPQPDGMDKGPEEPAQEEPAPKRRAHPPKEKKPEHEEKTDKPRRGRKPKEATQEQDSPAGKPRDKVSRGKRGKAAPVQDAPGGGAADTPTVGEDAPAPDVGQTPDPPAEEAAAPPRPVEDQKVVYLKLAETHPFHTYRQHPFSVRDDTKMQETVASIKLNGVLEPGLARPEKDGNGYEIISGHRRHRGSELAGLDEMPFIVREMTDHEAVQAMKDSNKQRDAMLPMEMARLLDLEMEDIKHQGIQLKNVAPGDIGKRSAEIVGEAHGINYKKVMRYIRLNSLVPELQDMVDGTAVNANGEPMKKLGFIPAVELSYIRPRNQQLIAVSIEGEQATPSVSQAKKLRELDQAGKLTGNESDFIISEAAARYFKAHGITKLPARKALQAEIEQLISEKDGLYNTYHEQKQRFRELQTVKRNIDQILRREEPHRRKEQSHER